MEGITNPVFVQLIEDVRADMALLRQYNQARGIIPATDETCGSNRS